MKQWIKISVFAFLLAGMTAGAAETVLVEGSVVENSATSLAGVEYKVTYDDTTGFVTFKGKGSTSADGCEVIFHAIDVLDDAGKHVLGYNGNCGHTPGPTDVLMTDMGDGWLGFSIKAADYSSTLGMFLTVVLREDDARNKERFFGINSMMSPNDWAGFDGSWENRIKIEFPFVEVVTVDPSPYLPGTDNPAAPSSMGEDLKITYKILSPLPFTADSAILEVRDKDGVVVYADNTIPKSGGTHLVKWLVSTASLRSVNSQKGPYEVKVTITKGGRSADDAETFNVEPSTVVVEAEKSVTTGNPITECMENRKVTFTATARGFVSEHNSGKSKPTSADHVIQFTFLYRDAKGIYGQVTDWSFDLVEDHDLKADNVPDGSADHFFVTPIRVLVTDDYTHQAASPNINIKVYELWIDYFRDSATSKDWKMCVGSNIAYKAISSMDCKDWKWDMQDGVPDAWNPAGGDAKEGAAMKIPLSDLTKAANKWFGKKYGTVDVYCKDEEGNPHHFYSTSMNPAKKAEVFFPPDIGSMNPSAAVSTANPPCWYKFWRQKDSAGKRAVDGLQDFTYKHEDGYGGSNYKVDYWLWFDLIILEVCKQAGGVHYPGGLFVNGVEYGGAKGIDCCKEVVEHEKQHNVYAKAILVKGKADNDPPTLGYAYRGDLIPDKDEPALGCDTGKKDTYDLEHLKAAVYAGYGDAEYGCLVHAKGKTGNASADWSKRGKQW